MGNEIDRKVGRRRRTWRHDRQRNRLSSRSKPRETHRGIIPTTNTRHSVFTNTVLHFVHKNELYNANLSTHLQTPQSSVTQFPQLHKSRRRRRETVAPTADRDDFTVNIYRNIARRRRRTAPYCTEPQATFTSVSGDRRTWKKDKYY